MIRSRALLVAALSAAALALTACSSGSATDAGPRTPQLQGFDVQDNRLLRVEDRTEAPVLSGETLEGEPLDLADYAGDVVVLNFWASWCAPCRAEAGNLAAVAEATADQGVSFVGVNIKDDRAAALAFERKQEVPYPSLHDQPGVSLTKFSTLVPQVPPTTLLLDREGRIAGRFIGGVTESELLGPVQVLAGEQA